MKMNLLIPRIRYEIKELLENIWQGYNIKNLSIEQFSNALSKDKKNVGKELRLILCEGYGRVFKIAVKNDEKLKHWLTEYFTNEI